MRPKVIIESFAGIAQSVEQLIRNEKVGGSIPLSGTTSVPQPSMQQPH